MDQFTFTTPSGRIDVARTEKSLTSYGGFVAFASFLKKSGIIEKLDDTCPIERTSNNATSVCDMRHGKSPRYTRVELTAKTYLMNSRTNGGLPDSAHSNRMSLILLQDLHCSAITYGHCLYDSSVQKNIRKLRLHEEKFSCFRLPLLN